MLTDLGLFMAGLLLLVLSADSFIHGARGLALHFGVSPFVVGLVLVGFGTSAPELSVNLVAALEGRLAMAAGNVVGSNIANIGLILGLSALLAPLAVQARLIRIETPLLIGVSFALWMLGMDGSLSRLDAGVLLLGFAGVLVLVARDARREPHAVCAELAAAASTRSDLGRNLLRLLLGLTLLVYASDLMVDSAANLARAWGMSELAIGLTVVAIGTSLPELAASAVAAWRGYSDLAIGNVIGSNLFNILLVLGLTSTIAPVPIDAGLLRFALPVMLVLTLALYPIVRSGARIDRREATLLLLAYVAFLTVQSMSA